MSEFETKEMIEGISRWVHCESPTADPAAVNRMIDLVAQEFADVPVHVERLPGGDGLGDCLIVSAGPENGEPHGLVLSHIDTVHPIGTLANDNPVRIEGDKLFGPGVMDMKGGAYMGMSAFRSLAREAKLGRRVVYMFTPDEEVGSVGTRGLIEARAEGAAYVLVTEPARPGGRVVTARRGSGRFDVHLRGIPAHSGSGQDVGRSAIREAAHQILAIEALNDEARGVSATVGLVKGGTAANTIPEHAWFKVDFRMREAEDAARLDAFVRNLEPRCPDVKIRVEGRITRPPYRKSEAIAELHARIQETSRAYGLPLEELPLALGGSDANFTAARGIPTMDGLGIEGFGGHTLEEHALITSILPRTNLLRDLMAQL
ncbi:M20 family metallopeptidase [Roseitranquillus sediminis]|uniref:M20 family metallopeptidase n=1 Tax=Roseitranquillus sediminis TaxID=2809051 RepID=UPI001D0C33A6|nr:M20 family metallopeptidase [Roseitranquillus sediminis]MBM9594710.1 M20 family metallopeptidase [Roseitranquillus sediminis]